MSAPLHPNQLREGAMVRDFRVMRWLGTGGFSFIFLVERGGQRYCMKVAARPVSQVDEDRLDDWMRREVVSLEDMVHPNLLPVLEWGRWPELETGYAYFVMPYVPGNTFHVWRWRERACLHRSVGVVCEHLKALEALHARGMCHRDIKAENLLVRQGDDKSFLIDFGSVHLPWARVLTEGLAPGTLHCQPPEAVAFLFSEAARPGSRLEARPEADLYAVGVLLYEMLTNCRPFSTRLSLEQLLIAIATMTPPDPRTFDPGLPVGLCTLVMRLLERSPGSAPRVPGPSARNWSGCERRRDIPPRGGPRRPGLPSARGRARCPRGWNCWRREGRRHRSRSRSHCPLPPGPRAGRHLAPGVHCGRVDVRDGRGGGGGSPCRSCSWGCSG